MSRHPLPRIWRPLLALVLLSLGASIALLFADMAILAFLVLATTALGTGIYVLGESSDLPGTTGDGNSNVP